MIWSHQVAQLLSFHCFSDEGNVYIWDVKSRRCVHKFVDDGCLMGTSVSVSDNGQFVATGYVVIHGPQCVRFGLVVIVNKLL